MKKFTLLNLFILLNVQLIFGQLPGSSSYTAGRKYQNITAILGAFPAEVTLIHDLIQQKKELTFRKIHFTEGMLNGKHVVLAETGVGKVNAAITTTILLDHFEPREVLFTGIAGGVDSTLSPGDLVIGRLVAYHDYGIVTPADMILRATRDPATQKENPIYFPCDSTLVQIAEKAGKQTTFQQVGNTKRMPKVVTGIIVTGDVFVSSATATKMLRQKMNASATEMEGAAVAQACWQQKVPFLVIRSLSDNAGNNAYGDLASFYKIAAENAAALVMAILKKL